MKLEQCHRSSAFSTVDQLTNDISFITLSLPSVKRANTTRKAAFIDLKTEQGSTALHYAAKESLQEMVIVLLKLGASRTLRDNFGRQPKDMTCDEKIVELLT